jgi:MerR family mercuric resistance operon transcriptional regulator
MSMVMTKAMTKVMTKTMTIGKLAKAAAVGVETVRYYQRTGLLAEPAPQGAYRYYADEHLQQLKFIRRAKDAGFSLDEIRQLLAMDAVRDRQKIHAMASHRLSDIETRIKDMQVLADRLKTLMVQCEEEKSGACCPIVETFRGEIF